MNSRDWTKSGGKLSFVSRSLESRSVCGGLGSLGLWLRCGHGGGRGGVHFDPSELPAGSHELLPHELLSQVLLCHERGMFRICYFRSGRIGLINQNDSCERCAPQTVFGMIMKT